MTAETTLDSSERDRSDVDSGRAAGRKPPGPRGLPVVGTLPWFLRDSLSFVENLSAEYGDVAASNVAGMDSYMLSHPDHIERVLVTEDHRFRKAAPAQGRLEPLFGNGLVVNDGESWRRQRARMQPAFRPAQITTYAEIMGRQGADLCEEWTDGQVVTVDDEMRRVTLAILVRSLFGTDLGAREAAIRDAFSTARGRFAGLNFWLPGWLPTPANRRFKHGRARLDAIVYDLIEERRGEAAERDDLLSTLLVAEDDDGERMTDQQVRDEAVTLLAAGHDTTALALTYAWHLLGTNPKAAERLHEEVDGLDTWPPGFADVPALEYTEAVVKEAMRLYPPTNATAREPIEDVVLDGYTIPADAIIFMSQWVVHRDERWWDEPEVFRPERWLEDDDERPEYASFPFGGGPRHCLGHRFATVEAQLLLATIASRWELEPVSSDLSVRPALMLRPTEPVEMVARRQ